MKRVLFTGAGGSATEALQRLLSDRYDLFFADADAAAFPPVVRNDRRIVIPMANDMNFSQSLADACRKFEIDILVPTVDEELSKVWNVAERIQSVSVVAPPPDFIALALDKFALMNELTRRGLDAPRTVLIDEIEQIGYPVFVKPRSGRGSRGTRIIANKREADAYLVLTEVLAKEILAQELLAGQEYSVMMAAAQDGTLAAVVPVRIDLKRGVTIRGATQADEEVGSYCRALHAKFNIAGTYNIQLMKGLDGRVLPFEINPRISTTTCLAIAAGIDPIAIATNDSASGNLLPFRSGVMLARTWHNAITAGSA